ncbi:WHG domain-containing protein [Gorillibacterium sp. CAU 1737]|uniref:TetR/AcrR family transcriptional regulator n=1 Tax=Gorillibacterium sp. CAU 1737 TaxID=3140362 RepID=UPI00326044D5
MSPRIGLDPQQVLQAAIELADTHGFESLTLALLAQKLTIRTPSLYNHVAGLPELRRLLALEGLERLAKDLRAAVPPEAATPAPTACALAFSRSYVHFARQHPGLYAAFQRAPEPGDEALAAAAQQVLDLTLLALAEFHLGEESAIHAVRGFRSLLHGFVSLEGQGGFGLPLRTDQSLTFLIETYLRGLSQLIS